MPSGLINIISYGANDLYLTGAPQITFFKIIYRRYTNFSKESVVIPINNLDFNNTVEVIIPNVGDLLGEMYLQINVPMMLFLKSDLGIDIVDNQDTTAQNNYNTITTFMTINANAYRIALQDVNAIGLPSQIMAQDIINNISNYPNSSTIINNYNSLLLTEYEIEQNQLVFPDISNISTIINNIQNDLSNDSNSWSNGQIFNTINTAIQISIKVQGYYYAKLLQYNIEYNKSVSPNAAFAWNRKLGHCIIDHVDMCIGSDRIDRHYGEWIDVWHSLAGKQDQEELYNIMIGDVPDMITFDNTQKPSFLLTVPLKFWFCKYSGLSLPLIALKYSVVSLSITLRRIEDCGYVEKNPNLDMINMISMTDIWEDSGRSLIGNILADYVYLDSLERKRFAQSSHEYLIEQVQDMLFDNISDPKLVINFDFRSPCKELIWIVQKTAYINNDSNYKKSLWTNYGLFADYTGNPIQNAYMDFNGYTRLLKMDGSYYNYVQSFGAHSNTPQDGINLYSFGLSPEEYQPSGSCNFTNISNALLYLQFDKYAFTYNDYDIDPSISTINPDPGTAPYPKVWNYPKVMPDSSKMLETTIRVRVFAISYNILRIIGGIGGIAYR